MSDMHCSLCSIELPKNPIIEETKQFCCAGCRAVYNILASSGSLKNFSETNVFKQAVSSGLISNPLLLEQIRIKEEGQDLEVEKIYLEVGQMWCPSCAEVIQLILLREKGVKSCMVDYATDLAAIQFFPRYISKESIISLIASLGYVPGFFNEKEKKEASSAIYFKFLIASFCSLNIMMFAYPLYATYFDAEGSDYGYLFAWLSFAFSLPVVFYSAKPIFKRFASSLKTGLFGMETLVVISTAAALLLSCFELFKGGTRVYFDTMAVIIALVLLGKMIESKAKFSAKEALFRLARSLPRRGRKVFEDGSKRFVPIKEIKPGDTVEVSFGERVVLDGVVINGSGSCDESLITGESKPVFKTVADKLVGGSILQSGSLSFQVSGCVEESTLNKILEMVEEGASKKTQYKRKADSIVCLFVPSVIIFACFTAVFCILFGVTDIETALIRSISVLLISCPCAIGIAVPLVEAHLMNQLAGLGVIVKNRGCLDVIGKETAFIFDKTGTLTEGRFKVMQGFEALLKQELSVLKAMTLKSIHPISLALSSAAAGQAACLDCFEEIPGRGLVAKIDGTEYLLGSALFMREKKIFLHKRKIKKDKTAVFFAKGGKLVATFLLGDQLRSSSTGLSRQLPGKKILLSGDSEAVVETVANRCGFKIWKSSMRPSEKKEYIDRLKKQGHIVAMIGDGINDAPVLAAADVGISVVSASDLSIQVSDLALTTEHLDVIVKMRRLALRAQKVIKQNLFWAFFYNVIGIGLAAFGLLSPIFAAGAMTVSSLIVVFNAKRV